MRRALTAIGPVLYEHARDAAARGDRMAGNAPPEALGGDEDPPPSPELARELAAIAEQERCGELPKRATAQLFSGRPGDEPAAFVSLVIPTDVLDGESWDVFLMRDSCTWKPVDAEVTVAGMRELHAPSGERLFVHWSIDDQCAMLLTVDRLAGGQLHHVFQAVESRAVEGACTLERRLELEEKDGELRGIRMLVVKPGTEELEERERYAWRGNALVPTLNPAAPPNLRSNE